MIDVWRVQNPELRRKKIQKYIADFFLVNECVVSNTINADIVPGYKTDHSMITLQLSLQSNLRGRGFWKLNTSFLKDEEYVNQIRAAISRTKDEYSQDNTVTSGLLWEMIKMKTSGTSINYGKPKKRNTTQKKDNIENSIKILEEQVANTSANNPQLLWTELDKKDAILRSKSRWHNKGEFTLRSGTACRERSPN